MFRAVVFLLAVHTIVKSSVDANSINNRSSSDDATKSNYSLSIHEVNQVLKTPNLHFEMPDLCNH